MPKWGNLNNKDYHMNAEKEEFVGDEYYIDLNIGIGLIKHFGQSRTVSTYLKV